MIDLTDQKECNLCPHHCGIDRTSKKLGFCRAGKDPLISSAMAHHGEEPPISGTCGSGTIFFSNCNMRCVYCQNYQISQSSAGTRYDVNGLSNLMLGLQSRGCHNINLVSPTIWLATIIPAIGKAKSSGLEIPIVYNTGGYEDPDIIRQLEGLIDIYMPDMRYSDDNKALKYSGVSEYVMYNREAVIEMYRQVGTLSLDKDGIARRGLLVRLLVLPGDISGIADTLKFLKDEVSLHTYLSIMSQYHPAYKARSLPGLDRQVTIKEYQMVTSYSHKLGFNNGWTQDHMSLEEDGYIPDFDDSEVFKSNKEGGN